MTPQHRFRTIVDELARLHAQREEAMLAAFAALERADAALAVLITQNVGDRVLGSEGADASMLPSDVRMAY